MSATPQHTVTAERALELINSGEALTDMLIEGKLDLTILAKDNFEKDLVADNCIFEHLQASCVQFTKTVKLTNSEFIKCEFTFSYFFGGLVIDNCIFENYLDFEAGGHNKNGNAISFTNSTFKNFVNFFDCWYESEVIIKNNDFQKGTNLLGTHKSNGIKTTFDVKPIIENNKGQLDINDEGDMETKTIYLR